MQGRMKPDHPRMHTAISVLGPDATPGHGSMRTCSPRVDTRHTCHLPKFLCRSCFMAILSGRVYRASVILSVGTHVSATAPNNHWRPWHESECRPQGAAK